jgi:hypothetical protein
MKQPELKDFIRKSQDVICPRKSIMDNVINPIRANEFFSEYGEEIINSIIECISKGESFEALIEKVSTAASEKPSIDMEEKILDINDRTKYIAPVEIEERKKWRKEGFWSKHITNVVNEIMLNARAEFEKEEEIYKKYKWNQENRTEGGDTQNDLIDLGF